MRWTGLTSIIGFCVIVAISFIVGIFSLGFIPTLVLTISIFLSLQALITIIWKSYAWLEPDTADQYKSPEVYSDPEKTFTLMIPARHESSVIGDTIRSLSRLNYPTKKYDAYVILREDDHKTIEEAHKVIAELRQSNINVMTFSGGPMNKPRHLNYALDNTEKEVIGIFDAEDEPDPDILNVINTVMLRDDSDVVQSGVQLMNFQSNWYSALNVLEYFFWFRSGIILFNKLAGVTPLGGNTVFFSRKHLEEVGGWSEDCLTEDALVGIELAQKQAKFSIVYDAKHSTQEETPPTIESFIKQRTRWHQGFIQILARFSWTKLPSLRQQLLVFYVLLQPVLVSLFSFSAVILISLSFVVDVPVVVSMISYLPLYLLMILFVIETIGLIEFASLYMKDIKLTHLLKLWLGYFPYITLLTISALRACIRQIRNNNSWEKTEHINAHRAETPALEYKVEIA